MCAEGGCARISGAAGTASDGRQGWGSGGADGAGAAAALPLTAGLGLEGRLGVEDREGAHKLAKFDHAVLLDVKQRKHLSPGGAWVAGGAWEG